MTTVKQCPQFALIRLSGADAVDFINNQIINSFDETISAPHYSAICNAKGRILFSLLLWFDDGDLVMAVDHSLADDLLAYINMRRFRMQLKCQTETKMYVVWNPAENQNLSALRLSQQQPQNKLTENEFWSLFFTFGLPWITVATSELFIPQHLSLDDHNLIEYQKGCYPGQEVIARLHFLGKVKKQLSLESITTENKETEINHAIADKVTLADGTKAQLCSPVVTINGSNKAQVVRVAAVN